VLRYTSCRKKQGSKSEKKLRKIKAPAKINQRLFANLNLENQRSNNTQTLKFLEKKFF